MLQSLRMERWWDIHAAEHFIVSDNFVPATAHRAQQFAAKRTECDVTLHASDVGVGGPSGQFFVKLNDSLNLSFLVDRIETLYLSFHKSYLHLIWNFVL
jgi:hypothetical protein